MTTAKNGSQSSPEVTQEHKIVTRQGGNFVSPGRVFSRARLRLRCAAPASQTCIFILSTCSTCLWFGVHTMLTPEQRAAADAILSNASHTPFERWRLMCNTVLTPETPFEHHQSMLAQVKSFGGLTGLYIICTRSVHSYCFMLY